MTLQIDRLASNSSLEHGCNIISLVHARNIEAVLTWTPPHLLSQRNMRNAIRY
jgi:hypothetical protein